MNGLTKIQEETVQLALDPKLKTYTAIAKRRGVVTQSVHEILNRPDVAAELERRERERSDKARGVIELGERQIYRLMKLIDKVFPEGATLGRDVCIDEVAKALIASTGAYSKVLEIREKYGIGKEETITPVDYERRMRVGMRIGIGIGKYGCFMGVKDTRSTP